MKMDYLSFSTRAASRAERSEQWREVTRAPQAELGDDREASIRGCDLGDVRICAVTIGEHRVESVECDHRDGGLEVLKFLFIEEGECRVEQDGVSVVLRAGQWCGIDKSRKFRLAAAGTTRQLTMSVPLELLRTWRDDRTGLVVPRGFLHGAGNVLHSSAAAAVNAAQHIGRRDRARLGHALANLLNVAWDADMPAMGGSTPRARRIAVLDFIERHLFESNLNVARIADELGLSTRTLHKLFADDAMTLSRIIWTRRLERCRQELIDPAQAGRSITEIAHSCGFSDSQHFSRAFKGHFGVTPRVFRNSHLLH